MFESGFFFMNAAGKHVAWSAVVVGDGARDIAIRTAKDTGQSVFVIGEMSKRKLWRADPDGTIVDMRKGR